MARTKNYKEHLLERLQSPEDVAGYVNAALDIAIEDQDIATFLLALRDAGDAQGLGKVAEQAKLNRENVYRMLSDQGNPRLKSLFSVLYVLGLKLHVEPIEGRANQRGKAMAAYAVAATSLGENKEVKSHSDKDEGINYGSNLQSDPQSLAA
jgi:probable addiction module antidote protein